MGVSGVARGGLFLFLGSLIVSILGFVYWVLISSLGGADVVGIASSVFSLSTLVSGIAVLGVPVGVQRFLGRDFGRRDVEGINTYFWSCFVFTMALCLLSGIAVCCIAFFNVSLLGFSTGMLLLTGLMTSLSFYGVLSALFASIIKTAYAAVSIVISTVIKVCIGVLLVYWGFGWAGAVIGLLSENLFVIVLLLFFAHRELKRMGSVKVHLSTEALRGSLRAGSVNWGPATIALLGSQLSFLTVYGIGGEFEAGAYYIAYSIFAVIYLLPASFMSILFPILSGLTVGRGEVAWRVLKLCFAFACPLTAFLMLYPTFPLSIIPGGNYLPAAPTLVLLASSTIPLTFIAAVNSLVYASGSYGKVLGIGLAINVPRVVLYFQLVPIYGGYGAALSFLTGAVTGLCVAIVVSKKIHFGVSFRKISIAIIVPFTAAITCYLVGLGWLIGGAVILLACTLFYGRLGVVERSDLSEIARAFASEKTVAKLGERLSKLLKIIYGE